MVILLLVFFLFKPSSILPSTVKPQLKLNGAELSLIVQWYTTHPDPPKYSYLKSKLYQLCSSLSGASGMEDNLTGRREKGLTGRRPHRKITSQEDDLTGRWPHRKKTLQEDDLTGRGPHWKKTLQEDNLTGRQIPWRWFHRNMTSQEDNLKWKQLKRKTTSQEDHLNETHQSRNNS